MSKSMMKISNVVNKKESYRQSFPIHKLDKNHKYYEKAVKAWKSFRLKDFNCILFEDKYCQVAIDKIGGWIHVCAMKAIKDRFIYNAFLIEYMGIYGKDLKNDPYAVLIGSNLDGRPNVGKCFNSFFYAVDYIGNHEICDIIYKKTGFYKHLKCLIKEDSSKKSGEDQKLFK